ncbi:hypothetical protein QFC19_007984 [Naganishia cerealis]|uniref:Uncharacterized protein n=1 Tax=Naganishia cerealis TaxID=610337 RepID=A0ACC2V4U1_9TREE|nr:hypothetical protein QFC19_007984 [Naganishia cerealis]
MAARTPRARSGSGRNLGPVTMTSNPDSSISITAPIPGKSGSIIPTPNGDVRVRPYRSTSTSQLKAMITFTPRASGLDRHNVKAAGDPFWGFYTLFWIGMYMANAFLTLGCEDALSSMMKMHSYCAHNGMLSDIYFKKKEEERHLQQLLDSFPDHGEKIRMEANSKAKEHERREADHQQESDPRILPKPTEQSTGEQTPLGNGDSSPGSSRRGSDIPVGTPMVPPGATSFTTGYVSQGDLLKLRLAPEVVAELNATSGPRARATASQKLSREQSPTPTPIGTPTLEGSGINTPSTIPTGNNADPHKSNVQLGTSLEPAHMASLRPRRPPSVLTYASDERVATLAKNIDTMQDELTSHGSGGIVWPENIGYKSYWEFMCMPTLCYQLWYPRTTTLRPTYVVEKVFATFGVFSLIYTITEYYILPYMPKPGESLLKAYMELAVPMIVNYLL